MRTLLAPYRAAELPRQESNKPLTGNLQGVARGYYLSNSDKTDYSPSYSDLSNEDWQKGTDTLTWSGLSDWSTYSESLREG